MWSQTLALGRWRNGGKKAELGVKNGETLLKGDLHSCVEPDSWTVEERWRNGGKKVELAVKNGETLLKGDLHSCVEPLLHLDGG